MKILEYIEKKGDGRYHCYSTKKMSLDQSESDILSYEDKPITVKGSCKFAETDMSRCHTVTIKKTIIEKSRPIFSFFLDGSRHVYKVDDILIGKKIFPVLCGQIIVGCCERKDRDTFKPALLTHKLVMSLPDDFDSDGEGVNFCRLYCEEINEKVISNSFYKYSDLKLDKILLYKTDQKNKSADEKDSYKSRGIAKIQSEMTDEEQRMVELLCKENKLDDEHYLIKDGSLEYNPRFSNFERAERTMQKGNYRYVVGVSKSFDPELINDFEGHRLSKTIANLKQYERTKAYLYPSPDNGVQYAVWYVRLRRNEVPRETNFSDIVKCEMVMINEDELIDTSLINVISANIIKEAFPVCYGKDLRWANHLYPVYLTESFCKSKYFGSEAILHIF